MTVPFTRAKRDAMKAYLDSATIKVALLMSSNTLATAGQEDVTNLGGLTLDRCDSAGYADPTVAAQVVNEDTGNNRAEFTFDPITFTGLPSCSRSIIGYLVYKFVTNDAGSTPIIYVPFSTPIVPNGGNVVLTPDAEGVLQLT